jgi:lysophospholipase L1-like esterase
VAIGDSSTEGLADPDGESGYRGWADRLAEIIANAQAEPLDYANLGVRSAHLSEIRTTQFDAAMAMQPDLFSIFGGANDMLSVTCDFAGIRADLAAIFGEARSRGCTVVTFTMPDPSSINPFGRRFRGRMFHFNDIIREEAERYGVLVMDFQHYPIIQDPRLFSEDRLHGNELGHERVAAALAWRLSIEGADEFGPNHSLRRRPGCGLVSSSPGTSNGLDGTSRPGSAGASGESPRAPELPRSGRCSPLCPNGGRKPRLQGSGAR